MNGQRLYSPQTKTFYIEGMHDHIPDDAIEVTQEQHAELIEGRCNGMCIEIVDGIPTLVPEQGPSDEDLARTARSTRNAWLTQCDRMVLMDAPITAEQQQQWIEFRQALRDLPLQSGFPRDIQWPVKPA